MTKLERSLKRLFDFCAALFGLLLCIWLILPCWLLATLDTRRNGFFVQTRIGRFGHSIRVVKIRTMRDITGVETSITVEKDPRISGLGALFRKTKLDELPQLFNVLIGKMSFVGPRPDVPGYADKLQGADREMLTLRPGITGPASLYFRNEESLLLQKEDPFKYNDEVLWPQKVKINLDYLHHYSLAYDIKLILATVLPLGRKGIESRIEKLLRTG